MKEPQWAASLAYQESLEKHSKQRAEQAAEKRGQDAENNVNLTEITTMLRDAAKESRKNSRVNFWILVFAIIAASPVFVALIKWLFLMCGMRY